MFNQKTIFQLKNIIVIIISLSLITTMDIPENNNSNNSTGAIPKTINENPKLFKLDINELIVQKKK